jgi:hypothetical protein
MLLSKHNIVDSNIITELTPYIVDTVCEYIRKSTQSEPECLNIQIISTLLEEIIMIINALKTYKCNDSKNYINKFVKNNEDTINSMVPLIKFKLYDIIENLKQINLYRINR